MGATTSTRSPSASLVADRAGDATKRPFTAVAILRPPKPRDCRASARLPGSISCASSLRKIRMVSLQHGIEDGIGDLACQCRRQQEAVSEQAVGAQDPAVAPNLWQIVGESRAKIGAQFDDLGLAEGGMERVGRVQQ